MAQVRIPSFLVKKDKESKERLMKQYLSWKKWEVSELLAKSLQDELDKLIEEDEKQDFSSEFQTSRKQAFRLGKREQLRHLIKDLT